jgi:hypothetical protein
VQTQKAECAFEKSKKIPVSILSEKLYERLVTYSDTVGGTTIYQVAYEDNTKHWHTVSSILIYICICIFIFS